MSDVDERTPLVVSEEHEAECDEHVPCQCVPARSVVGFLAFCAFLLLLSNRVSFSVAVVAMVNSTSPDTSLPASDGEWNVTGNVTSGLEESQTITDKGGTFDWDETTQGLILGAFFYGYFWPQMLFGQLAERVGGKVVLGVSVLTSSLLDLLLPLAAYTSVEMLVFIRALQGFAEGGNFPACHSMLGVWSPVKERSRLANLTYLGVEIGTVVGMITSGFLSEYGFAGGWPSIFYIHGTLGCVWFVVWMCLIYDTPDKHPRITTRERQFIGHTTIKKEKVKTPWYHIFTSPAVMAIVVLHFVVAWSFTAVSTMLPTYMSQILHFDVEQVGVLSSIPFIAMFIMEMVGSVALDTLHNMNITRHSRKICNTVGAVLAAAFFIAIGYVPSTSPILAISMLTLAVGFGAFGMCCLRVSHLDIAPRYAGTLYGLTNTLANTTGFLAPLLAGLLTQNQQTVEQWRIFFSINAALYLVGAVVFIIWGKGELQDWATLPSKNSPSSSISTPSFANTTITYTPLLNECHEGNSVEDH